MHFFFLHIPITYTITYHENTCEQWTMYGRFYCYDKLLYPKSYYVPMKEIVIYTFVAVVILIGCKNTFLNGYMDFGRLITTSALVIGVVAGESNGVSMVIFSGSVRFSRVINPRFR